METMRLGKTGLIVTKPAFGALPVQRRAMDDAVAILRRAYEGGIRYFDTANSYTDSEEKIGRALADVREDIVISTKSMGRDHDTVEAHIRLSLERMRTSYIDLFQFHMVSDWGDIDNGAWQAAVEAKEAGLVRHIGVTTHSLRFAFELVESGRFETMQYPFSYLSNEEEQRLVQLCREKDMGFIAVSAGEGLNEIFKSLGVDYIIEGGQTMNPSTADILDALDKVNADTVFVLPNNKNIILAANQAAIMAQDKKLCVIPTKTIPQGITAVINFVPDLSAEDNLQNMTAEIENVKTGQVTYAVRDTVIDDKEIKKDDYMGIGDKGILSAGQDIMKVTEEMVAGMVEEDSEIGRAHV